MSETKLAEPIPPTHQALRPPSPLEGDPATPDPIPVDRQYIYETLDTTRRQMRLIEVYYGTDYPYLVNGSIYFGCAIHTHDTDKMPPYVALSYTWGAPLPVRRVWINGKHWAVRDNLYNFLTYFADSEMHENEHLWVDSLCINQKDTRERNHQVSMMADIYRDSQFVITWLDESCRQPLQNILDGSPSPENLQSIMANRYFSRL